MKNERDKMVVDLNPDETYTLFLLYNNIFYKNIEDEICKILRIF